MRAVPAAACVPRVKLGHSRLLACSLLAWLCAFATNAIGQDLPTATYTTADGLPHDVVLRLFQDRSGFLWIGGATALVRFDGERFTRFGAADGLDVGTGVNEVAAGPDGHLWIATNGAGIFRFDLQTTSRARFTQVQVGDVRATNRVNTLVVAPDGNLWAGTDAGLFVGSLQQAMRRIALPHIAAEDQARVQIRSVVLKGSWVWIAAQTGVFRCASSGADCYRESSRGVRHFIPGLNGTLGMVRLDGVELWPVDSEGLLAGPPEVIGKGWRPRWVAPASDGLLVIGEDRRIIWSDTRTERVLFAAAEFSRVNHLLEDAAGNVWVGTNGGLLAIRRQGVTLFSSHPGLRQPVLRTLARTATGDPYALSEDYWLHRIDGNRVTSARVAPPAGTSRSSWPDTSIRLDSVGDVWLGTGSGLFRFSSVRFSSEPPATAVPAARYTRADGLAGNHIAEIFEDSRGDLWLANVPAGAETLTVWRRRTGRFERLGAAHGLPAGSQLGGFVEDSHGAVWARLREGGVARIRGNRVAVFGVERGFPLLVFGLLADRGGGLWVGGSDMLLRVADATAEAVNAMPVMPKLGATIVSLAQNQSGLVFAGTHEGLLAMNPADQRVRRFSPFDGVPRGSVDALVAEPAGTLLLIAGRTLARLDPSTPPRPLPPPRCLLSAMRIGGRVLPWPESGREQVNGLELSPSENQIEVEFTGLSPRLGEPLQYEHRLSGASDAWTRAADRRVVYAGLGPGRYTLEARVSGSDQSRSAPAIVSFRVLPPWYERWWFLTLVVSALLLGAYSAHRVQLAHALRTERLRSRIATDLHDDIGASLSQISILAEVARRRAGETAAVAPLASIADTSRDLVDSMSDIVWAVNPRTDSLSDLTHRMHRFAEETLGAADIALTFSAPPDDIHLKLGADLRRELYLILKESVNNIARHSGASAAVVRLSLARHQLRLEIADNGRGFDPGVPADGNGLASMRKRAAAFGGAFDIDSTPGHGTRVSLTASLRERPR
jgi:signal transduction histidine kinase/ligand-binding sensor domain-containing protein